MTSPLQPVSATAPHFSGSTPLGNKSAGYSTGKKAVWLILALSLALSLGYSFYHRIEPTVDARAYDQIARNILKGEGFREHTNIPLVYDPSIIRAGPLYEYFLASVYAVFGHHFEVVWIIQALLHASTAALLYFICVRMFVGSEKKKTIGLWAMTLFAFHPDLIEIAAMLMTETVYLFLVVSVLALFVLVFERPEKSFLALSLGLATGLAVLSRPPILFFVPVILFLYLVRKHFWQAVVFTVVFIAVLTPWSLRNYSVYTQFIPTTLIGEYNIWVGNTLLSSGGQIAGGPNPAFDYAQKQGYLGFKDEARKEFRAFIAEHPLVFAKLSMFRFVRYLSLIRPMGFWFYQSGTGQLLFVVCSLVSIAALFLFGFSGLWQAFKKKTLLFRYLLVFAALAPLPLLAATVESRYRFQLYPLLAIFAGYFLAQDEVTKSVRIKIFLAVCAVLSLISLIDLYSFWPTVVSHLNILLF